MFRLENYRILLTILFGFVATTSCFAQANEPNPAPQKTDARPNILFAIADDWGWPHAGAYGDQVIQTPTFDQIAARGLLFENAYVSCPSCTPSRNSILTGQHHWRLGWGGNLWSELDTRHKTYPLLLEDAGYYVGHTRKAWGPGKLKKGKRHPAGKKYKSFNEFLKNRPEGKPFCFWFGSSDPHRPYKNGTGKKSGMDLAKIKLFEHFPDDEIIRSDVADYYWEVQRFDREVGEVLKKLEATGELDNTIIVMTGDHGMPFPRCKANLYDSGVRVPMAVQWPAVIEPGRTVSDFVSTTDLAPTFLEAGNAKIPNATTGKSWLPIFHSKISGRIEPNRDHVFFGKERHVAAQEAPDSGGTPMRAIRTDNFLLIHNLTPERWPAGTPNWKDAFVYGCWYGDIDNGPTKTFMVDNQDRDDEYRRKFELSFGKRPEFELYDVRIDRDQINNLAGKPKYESTLKQLVERLTAELTRTEDPRIVGGAVELFEKTKYLGSGPRHPDSKKR